MFKTKCLITFFSFLNCSKIDAQIIYSTNGNPSLFKLSATFVEIDSQYYIIPILDIIKRDFKIRIRKKRNYVDGNFVKKSADAKIYLLKRIGNSYAYITLGKLNFDANSLLEKNEYINFRRGLI